MKIINKFIDLCPSCMEKHEIAIVETKETLVFQRQRINYLAQYCYCNNSQEFYETENQMNTNYIAMKNAYNAKIKD